MAALIISLHVIDSILSDFLCKVFNYWLRMGREIAQFGLLNDANRYGFTDDCSPMFNENTLSSPR